jgi:hypothetical protein
MTTSDMTGAPHVDRQWTVFGAGGAITVTLATAVLPVLLAERRNRGTS